MVIEPPVDDRGVALADLVRHQEGVILDLLAELPLGLPESAVGRLVGWPVEGSGPVVALVRVPQLSHRYNLN